MHTLSLFFIILSTFIPFGQTPYKNEKHAENIAFSKDNRDTPVSQQLAYCSSQVDRALESLRPYDFTMMPRNILNGQTTWNLRKAILGQYFLYSWHPSWLSRQVAWWFS